MGVSISLLSERAIRHHSRSQQLDPSRRGCGVLCCSLCNCFCCDLMAPGEEIASSGHGGSFADFAQSAGFQFSVLSALLSDGVSPDQMPGSLVLFQSEVMVPENTVLFFQDRVVIRRVCQIKFNFFSIFGKNSVTACPFIRFYRILH